MSSNHFNRSRNSRQTTSRGTRWVTWRAASGDNARNADARTLVMIPAGTCMCNPSVAVLKVSSSPRQSRNGKWYAVNDGKFVALNSIPCSLGRVGILAVGATPPIKSVTTCTSKRVVADTLSFAGAFKVVNYALEMSEIAKFSHHGLPTGRRVVLAGTSDQGRQGCWIPQSRLSSVLTVDDTFVREYHPERARVATRPPAICLVYCMALWSKLTAPTQLPVGI